jgi:hypothetical protein
MFSGGDYQECARWLWNFAEAHAKRESPRVEAVVDTAGAREGVSYGLQDRLGESLAPRAPLELTFEEVREGRGRIEWCQALAGRVRGLARELLAAERRTA